MWLSHPPYQHQQRLRLCASLASLCHSLSCPFCPIQTCRCPLRHVLPPQAPVTAAGAAETAAERQAASQEAQLAAVGEVGEWTLMQPAELAADGPGDAAMPAAAVQPAKKPIAVK